MAGLFEYFFFVLAAQTAAGQADLKFKSGSQRVWTNDSRDFLRRSGYFSTRYYNTYFGNKMWILKKGDEITDGYSGIFSNVPQEDRAQIHSRYHFDCLCQACQDSWPLKYQLPTAVPKNKEKLKELIKAKNSKELTVPEKTELMKQTLTEAYSILPKPHFVLCQLEDEFYNHLRINQ